MTKPKYPKGFLKQVKKITNKRAKIVIDHILKHGFITTQDLEVTYGYNHPPRAARDVRESGIPLETFNVKSKEGKSIAAYKFGDLTQIQTDRIEGRSSFSKDFKNILFNASGGHCAVCNGIFEKRYLQVDHKVPYQVGGDNKIRRTNNDFMLLCSSCNRSKSWSCEHCLNWIQKKDSTLCLNCYWGNPQNYTHIALEEIRRLDIQWSGNEVKHFDAIRLIALKNNIELPKFVKEVLIQRMEES
jgi:hypothetical protein